MVVDRSLPFTVYEVAFGGSCHGCEADQIVSINRVHTRNISAVGLKVLVGT
jgi:hypothetical protein